MTDNRGDQAERKENFVFASLCDNDFGQSLLEAVEYVWKNKETDLSTDDFSHFVIEYVVFAQAIRRIHPGLKRDTKAAESLRSYLEGSLRVTYEATQPAVDHDGGSAVLDTHTGLAWRV